MSFLNNEQNTHLEIYDIRYIYYIGHARCPRNKGLQTKQTDYEIHNLQKISFYCLFPQIHKKLLDVISWSRYAKNLTVLSGFQFDYTKNQFFCLWSTFRRTKMLNTQWLFWELLTKLSLWIPYLYFWLPIPTIF